MTLEQRIGRVIAILGLLFILGATLTPLPGGAAAAATTPFWCLVCGGLGGVDVMLNVVLFIPFAIGLRLAGVSFHRTVLVALLLTTFVEGMQVSVTTGRDASLSDILTNTTGGVIGAWLAPRLGLLVIPRRTAARALAVAWAVLWAAVWLATAWLLQPWAPAGPLRSGWAVSLPNYRTFNGRVLTAAAGEIPLAPGFVSDSTTLQRRFRSGDVELSFDAVVGPPAPKWAPAVALFSSLDFVAAAAFDARDDMVLELPTNAERLRLRTVAVRLDGGRPTVPGELVRVRGGARGRVLWLASTYGGERRYTSVALSPSFGWSLLLPFEYAYGPEVHFLTALWIAGLLLPLGYWSRWAQSAARPRRWPVVGLGTLVLVGLGLLPWGTGFPPVHPSEWLAAVVGLAAGWAGASRVAYLAGRCASPSASESCSS